LQINRPGDLPWRGDLKRKQVDLMTEQKHRDGLTRRTVLEAGGATALLLSTGLPSIAQAAATEGATENAAVGAVDVSLRVNGKTHALALDLRTTLLDTLRESIGLTGTKKGCDHGQCGACTILVNGRRINACLSLAVMHQDDEIITIEGLADGDELHPMQAACVARDGFQCGYCTPGQICSAVAMLQEAKAGWPSHVSTDVGVAEVTLSDAEIRERMSGNICRCSAYPNILAAIRDVSGRA
jgi:xanthine dehydrogenase YagT iron-sulfur-binding subunit